MRADGEVSELVDEHDLGSCAARRRSSSLLFPTTSQYGWPGVAAHPLRDAKLLEGMKGE